MLFWKKKYLIGSEMRIILLGNVWGIGRFFDLSYNLVGFELNVDFRNVLFDLYGVF